eukprot:scaffold7987_cov200-Cylindrotheca_fusiformis.AAC.21
MSSSVARTVRFLSSVHGTAASIRGGEKTMEEVARSKVFSPRHFPAFLAVVTATSGVAGFTFMNHLRRQRQQFNV